MKNIAEAVHEIIERRILPQVERDGVSKLVLPEQFTPVDCVRLKRCSRPCAAHREHEFGIGLAGKAPYCIDKKAFVFTPGRIVLMPGGTIHTAVQTTWWRNKDLNPNLPPSILWLTVFPFGVRVQVSRILAEDDAIESSQSYMLLDRHLSRLTNDLLEEVRSRRPFYASLARAYLAEFLVRCLRAAGADPAVDILAIPFQRRPRGEWFTQGTVSKKPKKKRRENRRSKTDSKQLSERVQMAEEFIHAHYHIPISPEDIAEAAESSASYLRRQFKAAAGVSMMQYLMDVRMAAARQLLMTNMKVAEVARLVGFEDHCYFSRAFRSDNGVSPAQYRQKMAKQARRSPLTRNPEKKS